MDKSLTSKFVLVFAAVGLGVSIVGLTYQLVVLQGRSLSIFISLIAALVGAGIGAYSARIAQLLKDVGASPRVFVSYSSAMKDEAKEIASALRNRGAHLWLDEERLSPGSDYAALIKKALDDTDFVIALIGRGASQYQALEIGAALAANKTVIPVVVDDEPIPSALRQLKYVDMRRSRAKKGLHELVEAVT